MPDRSTSRSSSHRTRGHAGVGLLMGGVVFVAALAASQGLTHLPRAAVAADPGKFFEANNVQPIVEALTRYAAASTDGRLFPRADDWIAQLGGHDLLPGHVLTPSPWKQPDAWFAFLPGHLHRQANVPEWPGDLVDAARIVRGVRASTVGTVLGGGTVPVRATFEATTFGALLYDVDPTGRVAVLYGVGRKGNAVVVASTHLLGQASSTASHNLRNPLQMLHQSFEVAGRAPNHDTLAWHLTLRNRSAYAVPAYLTLMFQGESEDDNIKVSGARFELPAGRTLAFDGQETFEPGQAKRVRHIRCELAGKAL